MDDGLQQLQSELEIGGQRSIHGKRLNRTFMAIEEILGVNAGSYHHALTHLGECAGERGSAFHLGHEPAPTASLASIEDPGAFQNG
jgi:hypothetical protein